ncbi:MAG: hypothetical protein MUP76_09790 [Acidimicrobiia bacterium]|nr:hypothetical protein [Acidimicrobiia bacterium]
MKGQEAKFVFLDELGPAPTGPALPSPRDIQDERLLKRWNEHWWKPPTPEERLRVASGAPQPLFRSGHASACLTHIVRFIAPHRAEGTTTAFGECGVQIPRAVFIDPADETFGCAKCIAQCEKYKRPTYKLIPDTGCAATNGERYRPKSVHLDDEKDRADGGDDVGNGVDRNVVHTEPYPHRAEWNDT